MPGTPDSPSATASYTITCAEAVTDTSGLAVEAAMASSSSSDIASDHASTGASGVTVQLAHGNARDAECDVPVVVAFADDTLPDSAARRFLLVVTSADLVPADQAAAASTGAAVAADGTAPADATGGAPVDPAAAATSAASASSSPAPQPVVLTDDVLNLLQAQAGGQ